MISSTQEKNTQIIVTIIYKSLREVVCEKLFKIPITWNSAVMRLLANIINFLSPPRKWGKWCRWSQERQLIAYGIVKK